MGRHRLGEPPEVSTAGLERATLEGMKKKAADIVSVTSVRRALSEDIEARTRRYLFSMGVRIICFFLMLIVPSWPAKIACALAAAVIPAIAVLVANAGVERGEAPTAASGHTFDHTGTDLELWDAAGQHTQLPPGSVAGRYAASRVDPNAEYLR